eukprot:scaffold764_cov248-Pinguiococcus_pyrenoidosus.AAC.6
MAPARCAALLLLCSLQLASALLRTSPVSRGFAALPRSGQRGLPLATLSSSSAEDVQPQEAPAKQKQKQKQTFGEKLNALYKFTRPHTIRGTILASVAGVVRALTTADELSVTAALFVRAFLGMMGLLFGNAFIVGINQIYDVAIDRINKPFLPVAAGEMSKRRAWVVVVASLVAGLAIVKTTFSPLIFSLYSLGLGLGAIYSIPPLTLKRFPLAAGGIIAVVRGFLLNFGVYYAVKEAFGVPFSWDPIVLFIARFMTVFAAMIAVTKDLPDVAGDIKYNVQTFASRLGVGKVATIATGTLVANYASAIVEAICRPGVFQPIPMIGGHALAAIYALWSRRKLKADDGASIKLFYKRIWNMFYFEYALYAFL